jgi:molybdenum-dependent DNA-binding transcriptional regulator ModE
VNAPRNFRERNFQPLKIRSKIRVEIGGGPIFGRGRSLLLEAIDRHGSIKQAARMINI